VLGVTIPLSLRGRANEVSNERRTSLAGAAKNAGRLGLLPLPPGRGLG